MIFETICLIVLGISGAYCYEAPVDYEPPGNCIFNVCFVEESELPIRASWYDPKLGGTNCMEPCDFLGDGSPVEDWYGKSLACPSDWYGRELYFPTLEETRPCRDSGGDIKPTCREVFVPDKGRVFTCYIAVDFLEKERPYFSYLLLKWRGESHGIISNMSYDKYHKREYSNESKRLGKRSNYHRQGR